MKNYILAHDLGTSGDKASLYDRDGRLIGSAFYGYETEYAHTGWAEQDPDDWWRAVCLSTRRLLAETRVPGAEIACLVMCGQMMGCVPVDKSGRAARKAIIWADQRAVEQDRWLESRISKAEVYHITGHRVGASTSLCKMLWLRDNQPDVYDAAHKFMEAKDAIVARLTGAFVTDPSDASSTNLYDLDTGGWSARVLDAAGLDAAQLPDIRPATEAAGGILPQVADEVGLPAGTPVIIGGGDAVCAAVGVGAARPGAAFTYLGTSAWIVLTTERPVREPDFKTYTFANVVPGLFCPCGAMQMAGGAYAWARHTLGAGDVKAAAELGLSAYELLNGQAEKSPPGANGLIFLPYLLGERSPHWNPRARGAFIGLTVRHTRADMVRAVLEGVALNMRVILDAFRGQDAPVDAMRLIGGGARGRLWTQIVADVYGMPIHRLAILEEATSMGAAVVGGIGAGLFPDWSMAERMNPVAEVITPDPAAQATYSRALPIFEAAYRALVPVFAQMGE
ncbi:MAG: FGGY-family carbohydrate kinase [Anaerolineae bacterium]|nr:FGGY-family carbohydrate kinase [Anaerolineae bacterium]